MNKRIIIIGVVILLLLIVVIAIIRTLANNIDSPKISPSSEVDISITQVPVSSQSPAKQIPNISASNPANNAANVPVNQEALGFTLGSGSIVKSEDVDFTIDPPVLFSYKAKNTSIEVTLLKLLQPGTTYSYSISINKGSPYVGWFTTSGPTPQTTPYSGEPAGFFEEEKEHQIQEFPDIYLSNYTPYETDQFTIESKHNATRGGFDFIVTKKGIIDQKDLQNQVNLWITSQGISQNQISNLTITYQ